MPAVMIGRHPTLPTVDIDNADAARQAVAHLVDHGCRQIAHIPGPCTIAAANERKAGYEAALSDARIPIDSSLIEPGDFTEISGYMAMRHLLERPEGRPDAVFGGSDTMAVGALRAIAEAGLSVPDDIAVMGFDGLSVHTRNYPNLSTLQQSIPNFGHTAVQLLLRRIADPDGPADHVYLGTTLSPRGSCGCGDAARTDLVPVEELASQLKDAPAMSACA
jgi:DNA-binding LacI/PurR family transcriptional regulator